MTMERAETSKTGGEGGPPITLRRAKDRGHASYGWLDTWHTFSFASYQDRDHMGFRALRVINDDRVAAGEGFPSHGHRDMEIVTYVLEGALEHKDSMGNSSVIRPGEVQRMTAGTGVVHSEYNHSREEPVHFLQIWIHPSQRGLRPGYEQRAFPEAERRGRLRLVASSDGREGSVRVHQDMSLYAASLEAGEGAVKALPSGRHAWIHVARGSVRLGGVELAEGDGASLAGPATISLEGVSGAEVLLFDLG